MNAAWRAGSLLGALALVPVFVTPGPRRIEAPGLALTAPDLAVGAGGDALLVSLGHADERDRLCAWFADAGGAWGERLELASADALFEPRVAALPDGGFAVAWSAVHAGDADVYFAHGPELETVERVAERVGADTHVSLAVAPDGTPWVAWQGVDGARTDLFVASRGDDGWDTRRVTDEAASDIAPSLAFDAAGVPWLAWSSFRHGSYADGNYELYAQRLDGDAEPRRVTDSTAADLEPALVAVGDGLALVWTESYFPTRRNGVLATVGYDRWADKLLRVAFLDGEAFGPSRELRLTDNEKSGSTISNRAFPVAAPDGESVWLVYGELVDEPVTEFQTRAVRVGPDGATEPVAVGSGAGGPAVRMGVARRGDRLAVARVAGPALEFATLPADAETRPFVAREATARKAPVPGLMSEQPGRDTRVTREHGEGETLTAWFGNLHLHSDLSRDARGYEGSPAMNFQVVQDLAELDFAGLSDHAEALQHTDWWDVRKTSDLWNRPGVFVTLPGYEWTSLSFGHRNVYFPDTAQADANAPYGALAPDGVERTPDDLWAHLGERQALTIPHHLSHALSKATDWSFESDRFQRLVEIFQVRGNYEYDGAPFQKTETQVTFEPGHSVRDALAKGQRVGILASPDHGGGMGLAGVWAEELTRESIFEALHARRTFGTTGAKMTLWLELAGSRGGTFAAGGRDGGSSLPQGTDASITEAEPQHVRASVRGTVPGLVLTLVRDGEEVHTWTSDTAAADVEWIDDEPWAGTRYWYLRAEQSDGHIGWTSPVWIDSGGD